MSCTNYDSFPVSSQTSQPVAIGLYIPTMPLSSPSDWEDNAELYHRAFWLDSAPPPLDDNFLSGSVTSEGAIGSPQNFPLPQQIPAQDLSRQPKQEPQVSEGNFPSFDGAFGQEPNGLYASETALPALTGDMYASGCPPQSVGYNPVPAPQQYWTPSLPSAVSQNFGCLDQFVGIENLHLGRAPFEYDQIQETQAFSSTCQNSRLPNSAPQFILDTNRQRLPSSSPSAIVQTFKNPSFVAVPEPTLTNIMRGRVRARRGQATDPHSIAERLRREKISERMKNLQELVPNATKTDKASMLESIISYVKFLQLQVKLLSTSRVRVVQADAIPSEEKSGHRTEENDQEKEESDESIEVEKQVLGLLESNMSGAMQFLRSNGLCLMPISLAAAISACKGAADRKKAHLANHDSRPIKTCDCHTKEEN